jgi:hypothetical protein
VGRAHRDGLSLRPGTARFWVRSAVLRAVGVRAERWQPPSGRNETKENQICAGLWCSRT